jgi:hypothetical protein
MEIYILTLNSQIFLTTVEDLKTAISDRFNDFQASTWYMFAITGGGGATTTVLIFHQSAHITSEQQTLGLCGHPVQGLAYGPGLWVKIEENYPKKWEGGCTI